MQTPRPEIVRIATSKDEEGIIALMRLAHIEQPIASLSEDKLRSIIKICTEDDPVKRKGIIGVIDGLNGIEGYFCAVFSEWWFSTEWRLEELSTFVHSDYRNGLHFKSLIQFAKWTAESFGLPLIMGITSLDRVIAKIRLYERVIDPMGGLFYYKPDGGASAQCSN